MMTTSEELFVISALIEFVYKYATDPIDAELETNITTWIVDKVGDLRFEAKLILQDKYYSCAVDKHLNMLDISELLETVKKFLTIIVKVSLQNKQKHNSKKLFEAKKRIIYLKHILEKVVNENAEEMKCQDRRSNLRVIDGGSR